MDQIGRSQRTGHYSSFNSSFKKKSAPVGKRLVLECMERKRLNFFLTFCHLISDTSNTSLQSAEGKSPQRALEETLPPGVLGRLGQKLPGAEKCKRDRDELANI